MGEREAVFYRTTNTSRPCPSMAAGAKALSAQPGSATGASTPFATVNVSPFLWYAPAAP